MRICTKPRYVLCDFPAEIPWQCITEVVRLVRKGDVSKDEALEIVQHAAYFVGSTAELFKSKDPDPEPDPAPDIDISVGAQEPKLVLEDVSNMSDDDAAQILEDMANQAYKGPLTDELWKLVVQVAVPILLRLIEKYLPKAA